MIHLFLVVALIYTLIYIKNMEACMLITKTKQNKNPKLYTSVKNFNVIRMLIVFHSRL